jgi:AcrR family transcriptional regulator
MRQKSEPASERGVLTPAVPWDIGHRSQRQRILKAMATSCAEKSFSATTIADIVGHASISRATFYKHFANKRECFDATAESFLDELRDTATEVQSPKDPPVEAVRNVAASVLEYLAAKPAYANLLVVEAPTVDPQIVRDYREIVTRSLASRLQSSKRTPRKGANPEIAFGRAKLLVADYVAAKKAKQLPSILPEIVYIALLPYVGQEAALAGAGIDR